MDVFEDEIVAAGGAHAEAVPGLLDASARVAAKDHEVRDAWGLAFRRGDADERDEVMQGGRHRREGLAAVDDPLPVGLHGGGVGEAAAGRAAEALFGSDAIAEPAILDGAAAELVEPLLPVVVRFALLSEGLEVHHEGERGGAVACRQFLLHAQVGAERGFLAAVAARHGQAIEAGLAQLVEVFEREAALAVVARCALREAPGEIARQRRPVGVVWHDGSLAERAAMRAVVYWGGQ